ncbi:PEP-CTERM domain protein [Oopsacas minuta]|uniref:PEP-CTERM domain protein n=1 Tax=Oopsacas minuta TaxID=111878 RepID=A0AAV7KEF2_9METZ|nr:PEP-CTERM domain protein [Oopsacas minuta]
MATANTLERIFSVDYKSKIQPILSVCTMGRGLENLDGPRGVTIDNSTGDIYVADCGNNCVKVFDNHGKIMFIFGDEEGEGKMNGPTGLAICRDRILISQSNGCILNYQVNGGFISRIGIPGKRELEFDYPRGLTFNEANGEVYICDCSNHRIQILSKELTYKTQFGQDNLRLPVDVKLTKEFIYILDQSNPCLHLYNYNLILHKSILSRGYGLQLMNPCFFDIDNSNNILIADRCTIASSGSISIFNSQFDLIHKISISSPTGVIVDYRRRVIVVCARVQMSKPGFSGKPESAIKRADEFIEVEKYDDAIEVLFDVLRNKRHRDKVNEQSLVIMKFCQLCVDHGKTTSVKDSLY